MENSFSYSISWSPMRKRDSLSERKRKYPSDSRNVKFDDAIDETIYDCRHAFSRVGP